MPSVYDNAELYDLFEEAGRWQVYRKHWEAILAGEPVKTLMDVSIGSGGVTLPLAELGYGAPRVLPFPAGGAAAEKAELRQSYGDSDFLRAVSQKDPAHVWRVMDELMETLHIVEPRVYNSVMRKLGA